MTDPGQLGAAPLSVSAATPVLLDLYPDYGDDAEFTAQIEDDARRISAPVVAAELRRLVTTVPDLTAPCVSALLARADELEAA